jgi:PAS domain S-box-containing protein
MNPKDRQAFADRIPADHYVRNAEIPIRKSDGSLLPCRVSSVMAQLNGRPSVLSFAHDISDLKRSELELHRNEEKFRRIFESSLDIIIVTEKATGKILEVNQEFMRLSGYLREEALGHTTFKLGLWADAEKCETLFRELGDYRRVEGMELSFVTRGGVVIPGLLSISPIKLDIGDCWLKVLRDISGVKETEARLRDSEATLRKIFDSNLDSMGILDAATNRYGSASTKNSAVPPDIPEKRSSAARLPNWEFGPILKTSKDLSMSCSKSSKSEIGKPSFASRTGRSHPVFFPG